MNTFGRLCLALLLVDVLFVARFGAELSNWPFGIAGGLMVPFVIYGGARNG